MAKGLGDRIAKVLEWHVHGLAWAWSESTVFAGFSLFLTTFFFTIPLQELNLACITAPTRFDSAWPTRSLRPLLRKLSWD
jgi:hypothetical protein